MDSIEVIRAMNKEKTKKSKKKGNKIMKNYVYFYTNRTILKKGEEYFEVVKVNILKNDINEAELKADTIAQKHKTTLAGGYFMQKGGLPYNFLTNYKVFNCPKNTKIRKSEKRQLVDMMIAYESGELEAEKTIDLFAKLVKSSQAWHLQGHYGRTASELIKLGYISKKGKVLKRG